MLLLKMRSGIFSYLFLGFLLLGGMGLVLMDWTGSYRSATGSNEVAKVGSDTISAIQFDREARRILRAQQMDPQMAYSVGMIDQILQLKITDLLLQKGAHDYGVSVDDKHVAKQVNDMLTPLATQSGASKKDVLKRILESNGMTEADLVANLRQDMGQKVLRDSITKNYYIPAAVVQDVHTYNSELRTVELVTIPDTSAKDVKDPDDATLAAYFDTIKEQYTEPESRNFTLAILDPNSVGGKTEISDDEVKAYYEENKASYEVGERRAIEQAVIDTPEKAQAVLKQVKENKKSLKDAVQSVTGDTKSYTAEAGFEKQGLPQELGDALFSAKEGDVIGPIKSALGQHIMVLKKIQEPQTEPFDKVSASIRQELLQTKKGEDLYALTSELEDRLAGGETLESVAKEYSLTLIPVKDARVSSQNIEAIKAYEADEPAILQAAFTQQEGESSQLADLSSGKMFTVRVDGIKAKRQKDLKEVKDEIKTRWLGEQRKKANAVFASEALKKLDKKETSLAEIAKQRGSSVQTLSSLSRTTKPPANLTASNLQQIMAAPKGEFIVLPANDGIMLGRVTAIQASGKPAAGKELEDLMTKVGSDASQENLLGFVDALQTKYKTTINERLLKQMYASDPAESQ